MPYLFFFFLSFKYNSVLLLRRRFTERADLIRVWNYTTDTPSKKFFLDFPPSSGATVYFERPTQSVRVSQQNDSAFGIPMIQNGLLDWFLMHIYCIANVQLVRENGRFLCLICHSGLLIYIFLNMGLFSEKFLTLSYCTILMPTLRSTMSRASSLNMDTMRETNLPAWPNSITIVFLLFFFFIIHSLFLPLLLLSQKNSFSPAQFIGYFLYEKKKSRVAYREEESSTTEQRIVG